MAMAKIKSSIPVYGTNCEVHEDRMTLPPDAFARIYPEEMQREHCDCVDPFDDKFFDVEAKKQYIKDHGPLPYDHKKNRPAAEGITYNGIANITRSCVSHSQHFKSFLLKMEDVLQGLRPRLNPGESNNMQRRFNKKSRDRNDRVLKRRNEIIMQNRDTDQSVRDNPNPTTPTYGPDGLMPFYGQGPMENPFDNTEFTRLLDWGNNSDVEENEPDLA